jgi:hypothetical protein
MSDEKLDQPTPERRLFLKSIGLTGAAALTSAGLSGAQTPASPAAPKSAPLPNIVAETMPPAHDPVTQTTSGADFMVDVLKTLDLEHLAINPASNFRGLHEAVINYECTSDHRVPLALVVKDPAVYGERFVELGREHKSHAMVRMFQDHDAAAEWLAVAGESR